MANQSPAFQFYPRDFVADVQHMTAEQIGAYWLLCCAAWHSERPGFLPNDEDELSRIAKLDRKGWARASKAILRALKATDDGLWVYSKRLVSECEKQAHRRNQASEAGKASAATKAERKLNEPPNGTSTKVQRTLNEGSTNHPTEFNPSSSSSSAKEKKPEEETDLAVGTAGRSKAKKTKDRPEWNAIIATYSDAWKSLHSLEGKGPVIEGQDVSGLARVYDAIGIEETKALIQRFVSDPDRFITGRGHILRDFPSRVTAYRAKPPAATGASPPSKFTKSQDALERFRRPA